MSEYINIMCAAKQKFVTHLECREGLHLQFLLLEGETK
jgi:hypothetical protein